MAQTIIKDTANRSKFDLNNQDENNKHTNNYRNYSKIEFNLPKSTTSRRGQLLLHPNVYNSNEKSSIPNSWLDNIDLNASTILSKQFDENVIFSKDDMIKKLGKNTDYFIHNLRFDSGKRKQSYLEYLANLDVKKTILQEKNRSSNQSKISSYSGLNELNDFISSDDEEYDGSSGSLKTRAETSRLSIQPILSTEKLLSRLSCKTRDLNKLSNGNNDNNLMLNREYSSSVCYNQIFVLGDIQNAEILNNNSDQSNNLTKINNSNNDKNLQSDEKKKSNILENVDLTEKTKIFNSIRNRRSSSAKTYNSKSSVNNSSEIIKLKLSIKNNQSHTDNDLHIPYLEHMFSNDESARSNFKTDPKSNSERGHSFGKRSKNAEPVTIKISRLENNLDGKTIKIRKFFDRDSVKIKKALIYTNNNKNNDLRAKKAITENTDSQNKPKIKLNRIITHAPLPKLDTLKKAHTDIVIENHQKEKNSQFIITENNDNQIKSSDHHNSFKESYEKFYAIKNQESSSLASFFTQERNINRLFRDTRSASPRVNYQNAFLLKEPTRDKLTHYENTNVSVDQIESMTHTDTNEINVAYYSTDKDYECAPKVTEEIHVFNEKIKIEESSLKTGILLELDNKNESEKIELNTELFEMNISNNTNPMLEIADSNLASDSVTRKKVEDNQNNQVVERVNVFNDSSYDIEKYSDEKLEKKNQLEFKTENVDQTTITPGLSEENTSSDLEPLKNVNAEHEKHDFQDLNNIINDSDKSILEDKSEREESTKQVEALQINEVAENKEQKQTKIENPVATKESKQVKTSIKESNVVDHTKKDTSSKTSQIKDKTIIKNIHEANSVSKLTVETKSKEDQYIILESTTKKENAEKEIDEKKELKQVAVENKQEELISNQDNNPSQVKETSEKLQKNLQNLKKGSKNPTKKLPKISTAKKTIPTTQKTEQQEPVLNKNSESFAVVEPKTQYFKNDLISRLLEPEETKQPEKSVIVIQNKTFPKKNEKYYPHLVIPWQYKDPIVDFDAYDSKFRVPETLCPHLTRLDPTTISLPEILLERRILEEKIMELRQSKLKTDKNFFMDKNKSKRDSKNKLNKSKEEIKRLKEIDLKERIMREERMRLHHESFKKKTEEQSLRLFLIDNMRKKQEEIEELYTELEQNKSEFHNHLNDIQSIINYLETKEEEIKQVLVSAHRENLEKLLKQQQLKRQLLNDEQDNIKEDKFLEYESKKKEIEWLLQLYGDGEELSKIKFLKNELESEISEWLLDFEKQCIEKEKKLDEEEQEEDEQLEQMELENEENALSPIQEEEFSLVSEKKKLIENYEIIVSKIEERIKQATKENENIEREIEELETNYNNNILEQREKLLELIEIEEAARQQVRDELESYKQNLLKVREKNLKMKYASSFLNHMHHITKDFNFKPHIFSYNVEWPLDAFSKNTNPDKNKKATKKK